MEDLWKMNYEDLSKYGCMEVFVRGELLKKTPPESGFLIAGWETTRKCNLRCLTCYSAAGNQIENELTKSEVIKYFKDGRNLGANLNHE